MNSIKFKPSEFQQFDSLAKSTAIAHLTKKGFTVTENPDKYGVDLIVNKLEKMYYFEVEVKRSFTTFESLQTYIHIPERKRKFFVLPNCFFMLFNATCDLALIISGATILNHGIVIEKKTNRDYSVSDKFFSVSQELFKRIKIND